MHATKAISSLIFSSYHVSVGNIYNTSNILYALMRFQVECNWFTAKSTIMKKCQILGHEINAKENCVTIMIKVQKECRSNI